MKPTFTRQLYWSGKEALKLVPEIEKIMKREQWSFNKFLLEASKEYEKRHREGNVSFQLDKFGVTWTKAESVNKKFCGVHGCNGQATGFGLYLKTGERYALCKAHYRLFAGVEAWKIE